MQAFDLASIAWPDDELELVDVFLFPAVEELWQTTNLLVVLVVKTALNNFVNEIKHGNLISLLLELLALFIK